MAWGKIKRVVAYIWDSEEFRWFLVEFTLVRYRKDIYSFAQEDGFVLVESVRPNGDFPAGVHECSWELYWNGETIERTDGRKGRWIVVGERYRYWPSPDFVRLECGHEIPVQKFKDGSKGFRLRRRCMVCEMEASEWKQ